MGRELMNEEASSLIAEIKHVQNGYTARFERHLKHSVEDVWSMLTENDKLSKWFPELSVENLCDGGVIQFDFGNGTVENLQIVEVKLDSVLEFTWWGDRVRFELYPVPDGCQLVLQRKIMAVTDHTSKDLAGWHVCLDVIAALLDGMTVDDREAQWKKWHAEYAQRIMKP